MRNGLTNRWRSVHMTAWRYCAFLVLFTVVLGAASAGWAGPPIIERSLERLSQSPPLCPDSFDFVVLGDSNTLKPLEQSDLFRQCLREINVLKPDLVVEVGDLILGGAAEGVPPQWDLFEETISICEPPYVSAPGNHDISDEATERLWQERMGSTHFSFSYGNSLFIILNSEEEGAIGRISDEQTAWMEGQLDSSTAKNVFVFVHQPHFATLGDPDTAPQNWARRWAHVAEAFRGHPVRVVFAGHEHGYLSCGTHEGVRYVICGGAGTYGLSGRDEEGGFNHYLLVRVRGEAVSWAVIKPGSVLPEEVVTSARMDELFNIRNKWVEAEEVFVPLGQSIDRDLIVTIHNPLDSLMQSSLTWETKPGWTVSPMEAAYEVPGSGSTRLTFRVAAESPRFPVPLFRTHYAQTQHGPAVDIEQDLRLVPTLSAMKAPSSVQLDGHLGEWAAAEWAELVYPVGFDGAERSDLESRLAFMWDEDWLYLAVETQDNEFHQPYAGDIVWSADNVEMFLDGWSWGLSLTEKGPEVFLYWGVDAPAETVNAEVKLGITRDGTRIVYEAAFPKSRLTPLQLARGSSFRFNALMNDLDPSGPVEKRHWLQLVPQSGSPGSRPPRVQVLLAE